MINNQSQSLNMLAKRLQQVIGVEVSLSDLEKFMNKSGTLENPAVVIPGIMSGYSGHFGYFGHDVTFFIKTLKSEKLSVQRIDYSGKKPAIELVQSAIAGLIKQDENWLYGGRSKSGRCDYGL